MSATSTYTIPFPCGDTMEVTARTSTYANNGITELSLETPQGEPVTTVTVNLPGTRPDPGCILVKDYSENEGLLAELVTAGLLEPTGRFFPSGQFVSVPEARIVGPVES